MHRNNPLPLLASIMGSLLVSVILVGASTSLIA